MGGFLARLILHTALFVPSVVLWIFGGWVLALIVALWVVGHHEAPFSVLLLVILYPLTGWWMGVTNVWAGDPVGI